MIECKLCAERLAAKELKVCSECIRNCFDEAFKFIEEAQTKARGELDLPTFPPKGKGIKCGICGNECIIGDGEVGYCGLSRNEGGRIIREVGTEDVGLVFGYKDYHVTNCTASFVCAGGTGAGYPKYAVRNGPEIGFANASLFLGSCSYHCLYCQNTDWHQMSMKKEPRMSTEELVDWILRDDEFTCVCWFGGSPETQAPFVYQVSRLLSERKGNRILRICLETNGNFAWHWLKRIAELSLESGGGIKFDLKCAPGSKLNIALSGIDNTVAYRNFERLVEFHRERKEVPFLRASTLLVPHYIDLEEVKRIIHFIAELDKSIPYNLLAFYPCYMLADLGFTSKKFALECLQAAKEAGLEKVTVGNVHLLT
ncbi:MAG: radical SAM protein [Candidatus Nanoarchaeia archaeon]|nr:radical SAM protein [Candidatus Haiyanarchaeum thermophilum]MCW1303173.1 radical SAM protein [Candidatus Haiyanarchaeum thermophilum]MCW1303839.1 radical SAM protein [Candidatus Haiyanarchaeum thermophilum]MCW1306545.1 radical SAM protein [Candidatus Haiyanarchaeum thermophilum]MCW1306959.1 radical SAM protein [Candidatus Haiyanarchaeum thermophilum]